MQESAISMKKGAFIPTIGFDGQKQSESSYEYDRISAPMKLVEEQKVTLHSTQFIQRFDTARPATIPSDGTEHKVTGYNTCYKNRILGNGSMYLY